MERIKVGTVGIVALIAVIMVTCVAVTGVAPVEAATCVYNRRAAVDYALRYCYNRNPAYPDFGTLDCTNFISQALHAGGHPMVGSGRWWGRWYLGYWYCHSKDEYSYTWSSAQRLRAFLIKSGRVDPYPIEFDKNRPWIVVWAVKNGYINIGDIIQIDYNKDGAVEHSMIITNIDKISGRVGVTYHSGLSGKDNIDVIDLTKEYPNAVFYAYHLKDFFNR